MNLGSGKLTKVWHVVCRRCSEWDIPSGSKKQAVLTLQDSGWEQIGASWICPRCIARAEGHEEKS